MRRVRLGVNIDHAATLRQARAGLRPDPVHAAILSELAGADAIVAHLREDRRHIQEEDLMRLKESLHIKFNLEMSMAPEIVRVALRIRPTQATLVPERRQELTTEGGLEVTKFERKMGRVIAELHRRGIQVSLFVDPDPKQIAACRRVGAKFIELHTGRYANAASEKARRETLKALQDGACYGQKLGLRIYAGHGLDYWNVQPLAQIQEVEELNIGHAIIARAVLVGISQAVSQMKELLSCA